MFELVKSGGWLMLPIITCSIVALGIVFEKLWSLQRKKVIPDYLMRQILQLHREKKLGLADLNKLRTSSPLGRILAAGLINRDYNKEVMKEAIEEIGRQVVHELERYLNTLGTVASISPLLGLLGTVIGMIKVFSVIVTAGVGDPGVLAAGISEALITTAAGLSVAIPSLMFHRYFSGLIDRLVMGMEEQALKLVEVIHGERELR
ncbi:MAG: MotA/TolQ/ExbB proton channel family protein [Candidatus Thiodiazotropha sp. (ex Lucinoma aequizonata)]|nr:MotA/TolQ/ExbB proton channel family protein [Candidatus Thiodiazotropha sp. (ex Lucinoma aequizonata)]MCU7889249.1 MotA/TolQ/ExbB proton channel family protein [Candidatus Thiodiazotropha sp. (ex Lucinoma aequizonata)]MCU7894183.1 MotA/TolQ/ExbB proton channel family protein [Candidatus Thiodiazotropha sp. (ex Lucinoma aequizonata)]MCU7898584.1 MotA/TolQ/ExbB proton channel family protein [Candidatus Thiodiazotropha sp. (ex Lucinoma aequizonata)]MCU7902753.1 MotA/TolQ/ExbB proton channel fa